MTIAAIVRPRLSGRRVPRGRGKSCVVRARETLIYRTFPAVGSISPGSQHRPRAPFGALVHIAIEGHLAMRGAGGRPRRREDDVSETDVPAAVDIDQCGRCRHGDT